MSEPDKQPTNESKAMKTTLKQQLQILTFADAEWKTERKYKHAINDAWFLHPQDKEFDFAHYDYRVVLPPLPEGYEIMPIGDVIEAYSDIVTLDAFTHRNWSNGKKKSEPYNVRLTVPGLIYAVKRQPTTKEVPLTAGDLPKGASLWLELGMSIYQVMEIKPDGVITHDNSFWRFTLIQEKRGRFSIDRETWVNGWKEEQQ